VVAPVAGLVLAAGEGRRIGRPKALVVVGGERLADRAVGTLVAGGCAPVLLVTGAADVTVAGARTVPNPDWRTGMASSLRAGLAALEGLDDRPDAVVVGLVDQPGIGPEVVRRLVAARAAGARVAVATYGGRPRNPVLLGREVWADVADAVHGDEGARGYLTAHPELVTAVECADIADPSDLDTAADVAAWGRRT
jgi:nicotine blue oxidoreductase